TCNLLIKHHEQFIRGIELRRRAFGAEAFRSTMADDSTNDYMRRERDRHFTVLDLMILVAAVAIGLGAAMSVFSFRLADHISTFPSVGPLDAPSNSTSAVIASGSEAPTLSQAPGEPDSSREGTATEVDLLPPPSANLPALAGVSARAAKVDRWIRASIFLD